MRLRAGFSGSEHLPPYLGGQQSGQVDLRHHLAASVALPLVRVIVVLHQVPQFGAALQVGGDHWGSGAQAVGAARRPQHALWNGFKMWNQNQFLYSTQRQLIK